jgi:hypothetical protein
MLNVKSLAVANYDMTLARKFTRCALVAAVGFLSKPFFGSWDMPGLAFTFTVLLMG